MAICVLEFDAIHEPTGEPRWPPTARNASVAFDTTLQLQQSTVYILVVPDADARIRLSTLTTTFVAAATDPFLAKNDTAGFHVRRVSGGCFITATAA